MYGVVSRIYATDHFEIQEMIKRLTVHDLRTGLPLRSARFPRNDNGLIIVTIQ